MCSQHCWGQGHSFWSSMCPKLIIICHLCWWLEPLGSATLFLQLALAVPGSLSSHCCSSAGACSSALCSQQDCQTHRAAQGPLLLTGGLLNRFPILPGQSSAFAPWITLTWADQVPSGLHNFTHVVIHLHITKRSISPCMPAANCVSEPSLCSSPVARY